MQHPALASKDRHRSVRAPALTRGANRRRDTKRARPPPTEQHCQNAGAVARLDRFDDRRGRVVGPLHCKDRGLERDQEVLFTVNVILEVKAKGNKKRGGTR